MSTAPDATDATNTVDQQVPGNDPGNDPGNHPGSRPGSDEAPWQRLDSRMIWVDVLQSLLSLSPAVIAVVGFGLDAGNILPLLAIAGSGVITAAVDAWRWLFTRYRVTANYVERRSGVFVRSHRSVQRDRIRSVDIDAKLRHRLAGLRVVKVGAGQQAAASESAFDLDAVSKPDAEELRRILARHRRPAASTADTRTAEAAGPVAADSAEVPAAAGTDAARPEADGTGLTPDVSDVPDERERDEQVLARFRPQWVVYNMVNVWAYVMALGVLWGGYLLASTFGLDLADVIGDGMDWEGLGWVWTVLIGLVGVGLVGVVGMAVNFFTENWNFVLSRVPGEHGTLLRTRKGLFRTREVNRDDNRMRGAQIAEPVLWRWMGMADTSVVTTGLDVWSVSEPATILPRGPVDVARPVTGVVLGSDPNPLEVPLARHPGAALRRRRWWATFTTLAVGAVLALAAAAGVIPLAGVVVGVGLLLPLALGAATVAYRALGHALVDGYVVMRSGLVSRATTALQRPAVSTIAIRESVLQRRLGLTTVAAMTSAGYGVYEAPDLAAEEAVRFAAEAAPGLLDPFLVRDEHAAANGPVGGGEPTATQAQR